MIRGLLAALALFFSFATTTSSADDHFLEVLRSRNIVYISPEWAIWDAHQVCNALQQGATPTQLAQTLMQQTNLDGYHAGFFVGASIGTYCPQWRL
ncbi:hypothetical protein MINTMi27_15670 [Mycobacterium intracellulare]|uniref:DUF732 domain-containing protein n=1 Tax=Mycobacterium intracellulare TaxID=1767 RepID=UPI00192642DA|nr:DUF732 domain-containing protein [Mycobacterium intracellulare]BCP41474.1 hypothetical protein MINTMi27_15670 [Mycobacterium intracellulare]